MNWEFAIVDLCDTSDNCIVGFCYKRIMKTVFKPWGDLLWNVCVASYSK